MRIQNNKVHAESGFTLIELMVVVAIISVVASMAIPQFNASRIAANEASAAATLRAIAVAQAQIRGQAAIDTNGDGAGEYGYLEELAGGAPLRIWAGAVPAAGTPGTDELAPAPLTAPFSDVQNSVVSRSGYIFQVWLPATPALGASTGIAEDPTGGKLAAPFPDPIAGSIGWCAYAWPMLRGETGMPVYFVSNAGEMLQYNNRGATIYSGLAGGPAFDAAYTVAGDMLSPPASATMPAADGNIWTLLR